MCMDVVSCALKNIVIYQKNFKVGRMYLKEIHYLGRKLRTNNPFYMLREAKAKYNFF